MRVWGGGGKCVVRPCYILLSIKEFNVLYIAEAITDAHTRVAMLKSKFRGYLKMKALWSQLM